MEQVKLYLRLILFKLFCVFPLQDKVIGSSFYGNKYENNPRYVLEALHRECPEIEIYWRKTKSSSFILPSYIKACTGIVREVYEYATAKVWIDSHQLPLYLKKRKGQFSIIAWHGGMGIKKIANDANGREKSNLPRHTAENTDLFISNSDYRTNIIRKALYYSGPVWKCGYPKNDILCYESTKEKEQICKKLCVSKETKIVLYAPTYRIDPNDVEPYLIDFLRLKQTLEEKTGANWIAVVHWHPSQKTIINRMHELYHGELIDLSTEDMQFLTLACDVFISDYSSGVFDAAIRRIPCFIYATDYEKYKVTPGVYYEINELPFPFASNNMELINNIKSFNKEVYQSKLDAFNTKHGIVETGRASQDVAHLILDYIKRKDFNLFDYIDTKR